MKEDVRASSREVYSVEMTLSESRTDVCFSLWHVADHLPCAVNVGSRERERVRESKRERERERERKEKEKE